MSNRREQRPKSIRNKKTSAYKPEKGFKSVGSPRAPKHRGRWDD